MELITRQNLANTVAKRWKQQYGQTLQILFDGRSSQDIYIELLKLGETPNLNDVENIISGWTKLRCDECEQYVDEVVQLGAVPDYDSATASICMKCLNQATQLY